MIATPTINDLPLRVEGFATLVEALDYAAKGKTGVNFYDGKGELTAAVPYAEVRARAQEMARRLLGLNLERGARVALVAETHADFPILFFACQYAGLVPVPLPADVRLGGSDSFIQQLRRLLINCRASVAVAPPLFVSFLLEASKGLGLRFAGGWEALFALPSSADRLKPSGPKEPAYLQYTSGSTRFPRGAVITQAAVTANLSGIARHGVQLTPEDRAMSWLPFYHDMGLVGLVLSPMASQRSVDYLSTRDFAMRPRLWLKIITQNRATISFSPPFGYELCGKRLRRTDISRYDLSAWRLAGVGAEPIRSASLMPFADLLKGAGFDKRAFVACYGMAECSLAVSFSPLGRGISVDRVLAGPLAVRQQAVPTDRCAAQSREFVLCGPPLPGYEIEVRDAHGRRLSDRRCGTLFVRGPSVMSGYFGEAVLTRELLSEDGWLDTGDLVYRIAEGIVITGRRKDLIIINGRNIWPQDIEHLAEQHPGVRTGGTSAFSISSPHGEEMAVLVVETPESDETRRSELVNRLKGDIRKDLGIDCHIGLAPRGTLPRTTSGKLSRSGARKIFLEQVAKGSMADPNPDLPEPLNRRTPQTRAFGKAHAANTMIQ